MKLCNGPALLFFIIVLSGVLSCKKKNGPAAFSDLKIATVDYAHAGEIEHYRVVYDGYNNVDSIVRTGGGTAVGNNGIKKFIYFGSSFSITDEIGYSFKVYANTNGLIIKVLIPDTLVMSYKGLQLDELDYKLAKSTPPYYTISSVYYTWSGGDVTYIGPAGSGGSSYYYDLSKSGQAGDIFRVGDFLSFGRSYVRTTHLPKGMITATDTVEKYYYQFESSTGRISQMLKVNTAAGFDDSFTYNYRYY